MNQLDEFDFKQCLLDLWEACSDRASWESGLTDVLAKKLLYASVQSREPEGWSQSQFDAAMHNYAIRKVLIGRL